MSEYEKLSLVDLRLAAKKLGIKGVTGYRKQELLDKVNEVVASGLSEQAEEAPKQEPTKSRVVKKRSAGKEASKRESAPKESLKRESVPKEKSVSERSGKEAAEHFEKEVPERSQGDITERQPERPRERHPQMRKKADGRTQGQAYNAHGNNNQSNTYSQNNAHGNNNQGNTYSQNNAYGNNNQSNTYSQNNTHANNQGNYSGNAQGQMRGRQMQPQQKRIQDLTPTEIEQLDSGIEREGILEVMSEGYGFIRCDNYLPGENDIYVAPALIRKYRLRTGDILVGNIRVKSQNEKFGALLYIKSVNGCAPDSIISRVRFEKLTPIFPNERIRLEIPGSQISMRMMDLISPIGKGQRGMIVSQPKTGKTTLLKQVAKSVKTNHPKMHLIVLLIDERPEEVTDIKESIMGHNVDVIYSTFDELPENHKRVSEMVIERAKRLVEQGEDVMILLDSITRLARAYNLTVQPSGRTLSGGLDPAALHMPKRFFGAARNMREGGSLTILATALVDTGSKMDDVVFEEFKGTGNMEIVLDRRLAEKRVFPAIDLPKSSTRREDLLLTQEEIEANYLMRKAFGGVKSDEAVEKIVDMFRRTKNNQEFIQLVRKVKIV